MKKIILILLLGITFYSAEGKKISIANDFARFKSDSGKVYLEYYYSFLDTNLKYNLCGEKKYAGALYQSIELISVETKKSEAFSQWIYTDTTTDKGGRGLPMFGQKVFRLNPGHYFAIVSYKDLNDTNTKSIDTLTNEKYSQLSILSFSETLVSQSDLQMSKFIKEAGKGDENSQFLKNSLMVFPNSMHYINSKEPTFYAYSEIYNAKKISPDGILIEYKILDNTKQVVSQIERKIASHADAFVNSIELPLYDLPSATYYFFQTIKYPKNNPTDSSVSAIKFFLTNPDYLPEPQATYTVEEKFQNSEYFSMNPERVKEEFEKVEMIATDSQKELFKSLTDNVAKQNFLFKFWLAKDNTPETAINETRIEFDERVKYADTFFSSPLKKHGWQTARGRIYLKYGKPTNIDRVQGVGENRSYETWNYDTQAGGRIFVFVDMFSNGYFQLVHSNSNDEVQDENWYKKHVVKNNMNANDSETKTSKFKDTFVK